jgi:hypothetical protein
MTRTKKSYSHVQTRRIEECSIHIEQYGFAPARLSDITVDTVSLAVFDELLTREDTAA